MKVLDVGGWGKLSYRLVQEGCDVTILNIDKPLCDTLPSKYPGVKIVCADIRESGLADNTFDAVHCSETLEHIIENRDVAIREIFRVIKPGGVFVGTIPIPGVCHGSWDKTISMMTPDEFKLAVSEYCSSVSIEPTGSIFKTNQPGSWYFVCRKLKQGK
jgi:2-polyprenyl-3-methyl-5-hydroxy-6-metoxy-1,4-benzoquinol methylase